MDPASFAELRDTFTAIQKLSPADRAARLAEIGRSNPRLRQQVEALLAQPSDSIEPLGLSDQVLGDIGTSSFRRVVPDRIGPYRITGLLGEGGMGVVYRAEQVEPIRREVAIKLVRHGFNSSRVARRFEAELQTLSLMDHPNIARVLDAGVHDDGSPYIAMELVRGAPVTEYCRDNAVPLRRRLELFRTIARAVQHAHQKGVIHRDLKPSNILIRTHDDAPVPKIIDFGIAKAIEPDAGAPTLTREGQLVGTLEYMSPEQARGVVAEIDTRSDVYSLGVVLYELVTGLLPYDVRGLPIPEAIRVITEGAPPAIRRDTASERLDPDIETIIRKAMEKQPDRRYAGAGTLADDVDRFLRSEPIVARPATRAYQFRKMVLRHRTMSASIGSGILLLVAFAVVVAFMLGRERHLRRRAELESRTSHRTSEFMKEVLLGSIPSEVGSEVTVRQMLDEARRKLSEGAPEEPTLEIAVRMALAQTYFGVSRLPEAESELRAALRACEGVAEPDSNPRTDILIELGKVLRDEGRPIEAESLWLVAVDLEREDRKGQPGRAAFLAKVADWRYTRGDYAAADTLYRRSLEMSRAVSSGPFEGEVERLQQAAACTAKLGRLDEAERWYRQSLDIAKHEPEKRGSERRIGASQLELGEFLLARGRYAEAESLLTAALEITEHESPDGFDEARIRARLQLGITRRCRGDEAGAESLLVQATAMAAPFPRARPQLVSARYQLGCLLGETNRFEPAGQSHAQAIADAESALEGKEPLKALALRGLGELRAEEGRYEEAVSLFRESLLILEREGEARRLEVAMTRLTLAMTLFDHEQQAGAELEIRRAMRELEGCGWSREWPGAVATNELACCLAFEREKGKVQGRLWSESRRELVGIASLVPVFVRRRAISHTIRAMNAAGEKPHGDYLLALRETSALGMDPAHPRFSSLTAPAPLLGVSSLASAGVADPGGALEFTGGSLFRIPNDTGLYGPPKVPWSIEFWINIPFSLVDQHIMGKRRGCDGKTAFWQVMYVDPRLACGADSCGMSALVPGYSTWFHFAFTDNGDSTRVYLNGRLVASQACHAGAVSDSPLLFGTSGACSSRNSFRGLLDEVRIWNVTRTPLDIARDYNREVDPATPGLIGYWKFNEPRGSQIARDASPRGHDGVLGDGPGEDVGDPTRIRSDVPLLSDSR